MKFQCVEFVKRYYYEFYQHKMPNSFGHAYSFSDKSLDDGKLNIDRDLIRFVSPSKSKPQVGDLIVMDATSLHGYEHVAFVSEVFNDEVQLIQQNPGAAASYRVWFDLNLHF